MTFSLSPSNGSLLPLIAASVKTRVVSWKEAAERKESVAREAFVIPSSTGMKCYSDVEVVPVPQETPEMPAEVEGEAV